MSIFSPSKITKTAHPGSRHNELTENMKKNVAVANSALIVIDSLDQLTLMKAGKATIT
jgi:hypothetical protein